jgi:hypothetical protein
MTSLLTRLRERFFRTTKPDSAFVAGSPMHTDDDMVAAFGQSDPNVNALLDACMKMSHAWQMLGKRCAIVVQLDGTERIIAPADYANVARMLYAAADRVADYATPTVQTKQ